MTEKVNLSIGDLVDSKANIYVTFHRCGDLQTAYNKLKPYTKFGSINKDSNNGTVWLKIESEINRQKVEFTAFL